MTSRRWPAVSVGPSSAYKGFRLPPENIVLAVRRYLRFGLSYGAVEELLTKGGTEVDHVTVYGWVQRFTPLRSGRRVRSITWVALVITAPTAPTTSAASPVPNAPVVGVAEVRAHDPVGACSAIFAGRDFDQTKTRGQLPRQARRRRP